MDEPKSPPARSAAKFGIAVGLLILPAVLFFACWFINRESPVLVVFFFGAPVVCGLGAGGVLGHMVRGSLLVRIVSGLLIALACVGVSIFLILAGCSVIAPLRS